MSAKAGIHPLDREASMHVISRPKPKLSWNQIDYSKATFFLREKSKRAQALSFYLSGMCSPMIHKGPAVPGPGRLATMVPFPNELPEAIKELEEGGNWKILWDETTGEALAFYPLFGGDASLKEKMSKYRPGVRQHKHLRYAGYPTADAVLVAAWALMNFPQYFTDLGYEEARNRGQEPPNQIWYQNHNGEWRAGKICHGTHFDHPILRRKTPEAFEYLANLTELPDEMLKNSRSVTLTFADFRQVGFDDTAAIRGAMFDLWCSGDWSIKFIPPANPESEDNDWRWRVKMTPTAQWHQAIWKMDFLTNGLHMKEWEVANGFYPMDRESSEENIYDKGPMLGYYKCYVLVGKDEVWPFYTGATLSSLDTRLKFHLLTPINTAMEKAIQDYVDSGQPPVIVPVAQVHLSRAAEFEMAVLHALEANGAPRLLNETRTVEENRKNITAAPELLEMDEQKRNGILQAQLLTHGPVKRADLSAYPFIEKAMESVFAEFEKQ